MFWNASKNCITKLFRVKKFEYIVKLMFENYEIQYLIVIYDNVKVLP